MFGSNDPFKKKTAKEMVKFFDHVPEGVVLWTHEVFYYAAIGVVANFGTEEGSLMMDEFQKFLAKCEEISEAANEAKKAKKNDPAFVNPENWTWSKN